MFSIYLFIYLIIIYPASYLSYQFTISNIQDIHLINGYLTSLYMYYISKYHACLLAIYLIHLSSIQLAYFLSILLVYYQSKQYDR